MASELAVAYLSIVPETSKIAPGVKKSLTGSQVSKATADGGAKMGSRFTEGFKRKLKIGAAVGAGLAAVAAGKFLKDSISQASDLGESLNAIEVTFGKNAKGIKQLGKEAAGAVGLSNEQFNSLAVQFSAFSQTIAGKGGDVVGTMKDLTTRGADFASVMNLDVNEAMGLFQSGLAGETEPLRKFGIDLSAAAVTSHAYAAGIAEAGEELTEQEKVQARYSLLMKQTAKTQGDFKNTSDSLANSQRILGANWKNIQAQVGGLLIPALEAISSWAVSKGLPALQRFGGFLKDTLGPVFKEISGGFRAFAAAWKYNDGEITSSGFPGFMERVGYIAHQVFDEIKGAITAFGAAWRYNDGEITSSGLPGFMERVGYWARQAFDYMNETGIPALKTAARWVMENRELLLHVAGGLALGLAALKAFMFIKTVTVAVRAFSAALSANPIGIVIVAIGALVGALVYLYKNNETARKIMDAAWAGIKKAVKAVVDWAQVHVWPVLQKGVERVAKVVTWLWKNIYGPAFKGIRSITSGAVTFLGDQFGTFRRGLDRMVTAAKAMKDGVGAAFNGLTSAVAGPIRTVVSWINRNFLDVLERGINRLPGVSGIDIPRLDVPAMFRASGGGGGGRAVQFAAEGGRIGGYSPSDTADNIPAMLTAGEYVLPVGAVRSLSQRFGGGFLESLRRGLPGYASGGWVSDLWDHAKSAGSAVKGNLGDWGSSLMDFIKDPAGTLKNLASGLWGGVGNSWPAQAGKGVLTNSLGKVAEHVKGLFGFGADGERMTGAGWPYSRITDLARSLHPGVRVTSTLRPGAVTASGVKSFHGLGRAADLVSGDMMGLVRQLAGTGVPWSELYYSPWGFMRRGQMVPRSQVAGSTISNHYDHVHAAMAQGGYVHPRSFDSGGTLVPGWNSVYNGTGDLEHLAPRGGGGSALPEYVTLIDESGALLGRMRVVAEQTAKYRALGQRQVSMAGGV